jgi:hypothetical protein
MAVIDVLQLSDVSPAPSIVVGAVVVPTGTAVRLASPPILDRGVMDFGYAIVVSIAPFVLVSERANMRWETTVKIADFTPVGMAMPDVLALCNTRLLA